DCLRAQGQRRARLSTLGDNNLPPSCGKEIEEGGVFLRAGKKAEIELPWHVGIYREDREDFTQICGGSLISSDAVLSAAHCFWDDNHEKAHNKSRFRVAVGKYYRDWNIKEEGMQERELKEIIIHDGYRGRARQFTNDVAILKLEKPVNLTPEIVPVCYDSQTHLVDGDIGKVSHWGVNEQNEWRKELISTQLPFVQFATCWNTIPQSFQQFLTRDKFCAGYTN
ncbi:hypothetical protein L9F63_021877, partial [Diploptera punctata]